MYEKKPVSVFLALYVNQQLITEHEVTVWGGFSVNSAAGLVNISVLSLMTHRSAANASLVLSVDVYRRFFKLFT